MSYTNIRDRKLPFMFQYVMELATFRHLAANLVASDLRTRFRRSYLGMLWAIIQPLAFSLMIAAVWGGLFQSTDYWEYALYIFSGMIVWELFANTALLSQDSLFAASGYLKQTRVPFLVFQVRQPLTSAVILAFGVVGFLIMGWSLGKLPAPGWHLLLLPAFVLIYLAFAIPVAIIMSVVGTLYRDVKHVSMIAVQGLFFISPVMLDRKILEKPGLEFLVYCNPVVPILDLFRDPALHGLLWEAQDLILIGSWIAAMWAVALLTAMRAGRKLIFAL